MPIAPFAYSVQGVHQALSDVLKEQLMKRQADLDEQRQKAAIDYQNNQLELQRQELAQRTSAHAEDLQLEKDKLSTGEKANNYALTDAMIRAGYTPTQGIMATRLNASGASEDEINKALGLAPTSGFAPVTSTPAAPTDIPYGSNIPALNLPQYRTSMPSNTGAVDMATFLGDPNVNPYADLPVEIAQSLSALDYESAMLKSNPTGYLRSIGSKIVNPADVQKFVNSRLDDIANQRKDIMSGYKWNLSYDQGERFHADTMAHQQKEMEIDGLKFNANQYLEGLKFGADMAKTEEERIRYTNNAINSMIDDVMKTFDTLYDDPNAVAKESGVKPKIHSKLYSVVSSNPAYSKLNDAEKKLKYRNTLRPQIIADSIVKGTYFTPQQLLDLQQTDLIAKLTPMVIAAHAQTGNSTTTFFKEYQALAADPAWKQVIAQVGEANFIRTYKFAVKAVTNEWFDGSPKPMKSRGSR